MAISANRELIMLTQRPITNNKERMPEGILFYNLPVTLKLVYLAIPKKAILVVAVVLVW